MADLKNDRQAGLRQLLRALDPMLQPGEFVFRSFPLDADPPSDAIAWFREAEGTSAIVRASDEAERFAWVSLGVESPLSSVGLTAAVATALAEAGIACNVVAAARQDHLFVPVDRAVEAMAVLKRVQVES
jgi:uncharacterized protein